jgi:hypothetical protein
MSGLGLWKVAGVCHRAAMSGRLVPMRVGDVELLVETVAVAGSEPTTRLGDAGAQVVEAYERAQDAIVALGGSVATGLTIPSQFIHVRRPPMIATCAGGCAWVLAKHRRSSGT